MPDNQTMKDGSIEKVAEALRTLGQKRSERKRVKGKSPFCRFLVANRNETKKRHVFRWCAVRPSQIGRRSAGEGKSRRLFTTCPRMNDMWILYEDFSEFPKFWTWISHFNISTFRHDGQGREALVVASTPKSSRDVTPHGRMGTKVRIWVGFRESNIGEPM